MKRINQNRGRRSPRPVGKVTVTFGETSSESHSSEQSNTARGSMLTAGGDINIVAIGAGANSNSASFSVTTGGLTATTGDEANGLVVQANSSVGTGFFGIGSNAAFGMGGITMTANPGAVKIGVSNGLTVGFRK